MLGDSRDNPKIGHFADLFSQLADEIKTWQLHQCNVLRAHVHKNQTKSKILGKCRKMDRSIGRSLSETNTSILSFAEYRFVFREIDNP